MRFASHIYACQIKIEGAHRETLQLVGEMVEKSIE